jgi:membrane protein DedA with SNARE-associated domain
MRASTDVAAAYGLAAKPFVVVLVVLFAIVFARSHLTYWAGRGVVRGAMYGQERIGGPAWWRAMVLRIAAFAASAPARRGLALLHRFGPVAVTLAYLTVGVQTAVFAGSGLLRMPYARFTLASIPGAAAWALVWATVGFGAVWGAFALAAGSPWALVAVLVVVAAVAAGFVVRGRRRAPKPPTPARVP